MVILEGVTFGSLVKIKGHYFLTVNSERSLDNPNLPLIAFPRIGWGYHIVHYPEDTEVEVIEEDFLSKVRDILYNE